MLEKCQLAAVEKQTENGFYYEDMFKGYIGESSIPLKCMDCLKRALEKDENIVEYENNDYAARIVMKQFDPDFDPDYPSGLGGKWTEYGIKTDGEPHGRVGMFEIGYEDSNADRGVVASTTVIRYECPNS